MTVLLGRDLDIEIGPLSPSPKFSSKTVLEPRLCSESAECLLCFFFVLLPRPAEMFGCFLAVSINRGIVSFPLISSKYSFLDERTRFRRRLCLEASSIALRIGSNYFIFEKIEKFCKLNLSHLQQLTFSSIAFSIRPDCIKMFSASCTFPERIARRAFRVGSSPPFS